MKSRNTALFIFFLMFTPLALADYDRRLGTHVSHHQWAAFYAGIAVRQAREGRHAHCSFHDRHWSRNFDFHYTWASRNSRHKGWVQIDRRDKALTRCLRRHGAYNGYYERDYRDYQPDYRRLWRQFHYESRNGRAGHRNFGHERHDWRVWRDWRRDHDRHDGWRRDDRNHEGRNRGDRRRGG